MVLGQDREMVEQFDALQDAVATAVSGDILPLMEMILKVQSKEGVMVPFVLNRAQKLIWDNRSPADINVKAAQMGISTMEIASMFTECMVQSGLECIIVAQREESVTELFQMINTFIAAMPEYMRPALDKETEHTIIFDHSVEQPGLTSRITTGTINSRSVGRGRPRHRALFTEVAFYPTDAQVTMAGIIARMPRGISRVVLESTADGQAGYFYELWQMATAGEKDQKSFTAYKPHFIPWFLAAEYRYPMTPGDKWGGPITSYSDGETFLKMRFKLDDDQIRWRRWQEALIGEDMRKQEFPESPDEAFLPLGAAVFETHVVDRHAYTIEDAGVRAGAQDYIPNYDVWKEADFGQPYIVSLDQASGEQRDPNNRPLDFSAITVWNAINLEQMATFRDRSLLSKDFAALAVDIAKKYNDALIVPEANLAKFGFTDWLIELGAGPIYMHRYIDSKTLRVGYPVNVATKPALKDNFRMVLQQEGGCYIRSANLIKEMRNYRYLKGSGMRSMGAPVGGNDDELMTAFFAFDQEVRSQAMSIVRRSGSSSIKARGAKAF